jgi:CBS domain-containing protein
MTHFAMPVSLYMSAPVFTVDEDASLMDVHRTLASRGVSSVAVTGEGGRPVGVVSRTDLLRIGRLGARAYGKKALLALPERPVRDVMRKELFSVTPSTSVGAAAGMMVEHRVHRVFVVEEGELVGVLSTKDVLAVLRDKRVMTPIVEVMSSPVFTVRTTDPVSLATDRLEKAHVSGLVVVDEEEWPVGTFTQLEGLESRSLPGATQVEEAMSYAMLCLDVRTPLCRAAAQARATKARRVLAVEDRKVKGILSGIDFARAAR